MLPLRWRLVLITTTLMAIVLATIGTVILIRFRADLIATVDTSLRLRAERLVGVNDHLPVSELTAIEPDESFGQVLSARGDVLDESVGLTSEPMLTASQAASVPREGQIYSADSRRSRRSFPRACSHGLFPVATSP